MSAYDKIYNVLKEWYTDEQIDVIWKMLKKYDEELSDKDKLKPPEVCGSIWGK